jgi:hypothetical protein
MVGKHSSQPLRSWRENSPPGTGLRSGRAGSRHSHSRPLPAERRDTILPPQSGTTVSRNRALETTIASNPAYSASSIDMQKSLLSALGGGHAAMRETVDTGVVFRLSHGPVNLLTACGRDANIPHVRWTGCQVVKPIWREV